MQKFESIKEIRDFLDKMGVVFEHRPNPFISGKIYYGGQLVDFWLEHYSYEAFHMTQLDYLNFIVEDYTNILLQFPVDPKFKN